MAIGCQEHIENASHKNRIAQSRGERSESARAMACFLDATRGDGTDSTKNPQESGRRRGEEGSEGETERSRVARLHDFFGIALIPRMSAARSAAERRRVGKVGRFIY